jgi:hypothetical protein
MRVRLGIVLFAFIAGPLSAATFTVTNTNDLGAGSLRQAIIDANTNPGADTIAFSIGAGPQTIMPLSALPAITGQADIDGTTQPGYVATPLIEINGTSAGGFVSGLWLQADFTTVSALSITGFTDGILVAAPYAHIYGDYIGLRGDGVTELPNLNGVQCTTGCDFIDIAGSVISGNGSIGVLLNGFSTDGTVRASKIGTDASGLLARPNNIGVDVRSGTAVIGGNLPQIFGNTISGNTLAGILIESPSKNVGVGGNFIGLGGDGTTPLGNGSHGIDAGATGALLGIVGSGNVIAFNGGNGIDIQTGAANTGNAIRGNDIYSNALLGIGFGGGIVVPNDADDVDAGSANNLQNHPVLTSAVFSGGNVTITGTLNSTPSSTFDIDFFRNDVCDASGFGEGQTYLATATINTDVNGDAAINSIVPTAGGGFITATATNTSTADSSQFSACRAIVNAAASTVTLSTANVLVNEGAGFVVITVNRTGSSSGPATVQYATSNGSATAGSDYTATSGMLVWADGDAAPKMFQVPILNDLVVEANETFTVTLSNATGATLGATTAATVTIVDDDAIVTAPTLSEWALILLAGMIGIAALRRL